MGFFAFVGIVTSAVVSIAAKVAAAVKTVGTVVKVLVTDPKFWETVREIIGVLKDLGIIETNEKPEEIGDKCKQAEEAGIDRTKFDKFEEYEKAIREFKLDPEKSKNISIEEKLQYAMGFYSMMLEEKDKIAFEDIVKFSKYLIKFNDLLRPYSKEIFDTFREKDLSLSNIDNFFNKNLKMSEDIKVENALVEAIQKKQPEKNRDEILDEFQEMRKAGE